MSHKSGMKCFSKQVQALEYLKSNSNKELKVFSREFDNSGRRYFIVASEHDFWLEYQKCREKNHYEVILSDSISKLYLDLEFPKEGNEGKDGEEMCKLLVSKVLDCLLNSFNHSCTTKDVLVLDSSNQSKYSNHVIFTRTCFRTNKLISTFLNVLKSSLTPSDEAIFQVRNKGKLTSFVDESVYSKNRNFRLIESWKYGKSTPLSVAAFDEHSLKFSTLSAEESKFLIFKSSLVTSVEKDSTLIDIPSQPATISNNSAEPTISSNNSLAPYPELDEFVQSLLPPGAFIRSWRISRSYMSNILYNIGGRRYCANVGRDHRHNHVYYLCNIPKMTIVQMCNSCVGYKSDEIQVPTAVMWWLNDFDDTFSAEAL